MSDFQWHWYQGPRLYPCRINANSEAALHEAIRLFHQRYPSTGIYLTQGAMFGHGGGAGPSAGTHDGGGVFDVAAYNLSEPEALWMVRCLRLVGFAAWRRHYIAGLWPRHIHSVRIGDRSLSHAADNQVPSYRAHRNGLANDAWDDEPWVGVTDWETYKRHHNVHPQPPPHPHPAPPKPHPVPPKPHPTPPPTPGPVVQKGIFNMTEISGTNRTKPISLKAGKDLILPLDDEHGFPTVIAGNTPDFQIKVRVQVTGLPAGQSIQFRCFQGDYQALKGKPSTWKPLFYGGGDLQQFRSDGGVMHHVFFFDGSVSGEPKGFSRRVRIAAQASADCEITQISTRTRKA